ncbi:MAG: LysM peptidoglycan-binding domain-containing protein [Steroidobacteraceae bacterium]|jgi:hypothetical protein|nr:LysM peptidoglycan-binding domain-containing protein [Steroidobacteraceae bacterium]
MNRFLNLASFAVVGALLGHGAALAQQPAEPARSARVAPSVPLAPDAPSTYTVVRGDTLWDISSRFLSQPWFWPEIWYINPEIENPHLIYPGDVLRLVYGADGRPQIRVERGNTVVLTPQMRTTPLDQSIPPIPYEIVAAFMSKPTVLDADEANRLPYVVAHREGRVIGGMGDVVYGKRVEAEPGTRYNVVHLGERLKDPETGDVLGWQGVYAGIARVEPATAGEGDRKVTKLTIVESVRETLEGDRLVKDGIDLPLDFVPSAPSQPVDGRIMAVTDGVSMIGQYQVVVLNRGTRHGLQPGNVLSVWSRGEKVRDQGTATGWAREFRRPFASRVRLPDEHAGNMMVFRTFDRMSYALVVSSENVMRVGDAVKNPDAVR